jgi:hypothetical protein
MLYNVQGNGRCGLTYNDKLSMLTCVCKNQIEIKKKELCKGGIWGKVDNHCMISMQFDMYLYNSSIFAVY